MTITSKLNKGYGKFFDKATHVAFYPYKAAYKAGGNKPRERFDTHSGLRTCICLTIVPVLPVMTSITMTIALTGAVLAAGSAFLTYPVAIGADACLDSSEQTNTARPRRLKAESRRP